jgi:hypothetical protein
MKKLLIVLPVGLIAWYVYKNYIQHNTAVGGFPTIGMGGAATHPINPL